MPNNFFFYNHKGGNIRAAEQINEDLYNVFWYEDGGNKISMQYSKGAIEHFINNHDWVVVDNWYEDADDIEET